jgi:hypothetical protein
VVLGLTNRIIRIMYGPTVGTRNIAITMYVHTIPMRYLSLPRGWLECTKHQRLTSDNDTIEINDSPDHYVVYAWQRMLRTSLMLLRVCCEKVNTMHSHIPYQRT